MIRISNIKLPLDHSQEALDAQVLSCLKISPEQVVKSTVFRRGIDARNKKSIFLMYTLDVETRLDDELLAKFDRDPNIKKTPDMAYKFVAQAGEDLQERPVVVGFGPCGIFVGLVLAEMGYKPIILDRGKEVRERTKDTFGFWRKKQLNTESNVQYGEGGAGTFSDGKLSTQIKDKKHYSRKVLNEFVDAGAPEEILYVSKPHIGTFKLVSMVEKMRAKIIALGGEIRFGARVDDLHLEDGQVTGLTLADGSQIKSKHIALAIGHSARDTFEMIHNKGIYVEAKPFSVGFRVEHKQSLIDKNYYGEFAGHPTLGAADYKLVHHCNNGRSVYSFCMCPGGTVVAATSEENRVVTNGMSQYSRNEMNANSAIVVGIDPSDYPGHPLAGIDFQRQLESAAYQLGGENYDAPAQLVGDFLKGKSSQSLGEVEPSYKPGIKLTDLSKLLPDYCIDAIREALPAFNRKIKGFAMDEATLTGVETRTSSPICIKRDDSLQSLNTRGLFPAGEGAGYAGGIMSAAIDGIKVAEAMALSINGDN
ncbi:NAD(P)/FAD-dependent oxidoreductase [Thalassomonas haliotis]|uniref:NAD(P)/FAD-dependent oxidoreductase n=1 Tax=Thalassomonas haliotis TaxID=485448 RepID=A0ABY7VK78_9GAMM|nr:NAD(P)/FAD-dependent oxidoreductase [Thalassomonas haliotis]WDE14144.1 NAD(P)/FAD-dependent oxidoreductase [Thalassomonas haliotis]